MKNESKKIKIKGIPFGVLLAGKVHDGSKTVTRRVVAINGNPVLEPIEIEEADSGFVYNRALGNFPVTGAMPCPYTVGQLLYVREPWQVSAYHDAPSGSKHIPDQEVVNYLSDKVQIGMLGRRRIARFMPARFARTFLRVTGVRCERLGEISHSDAVYEGVDSMVHDDERVFYDYLSKGHDMDIDAIESFFSLWDSINGKDSHLQNPWVWVISFERVEMPNPWNLDSPWTPSWTKCDSEWLYGNRDHVLGCDYAITVAFDGFMLWDWSVSICGKVTDEGHAGSDDEAKSNAVKAYRKSSKGIAPHLL